MPRVRHVSSPRERFSTANKEVVPIARTYASHPSFTRPRSVAPPPERIPSLLMMISVMSRAIMVSAGDIFPNHCFCILILSLAGLHTSRYQLTEVGSRAGTEIIKKSSSQKTSSLNKSSQKCDSMRPLLQRNKIPTFLYRNPTFDRAFTAEYIHAKSWSTTYIGFEGSLTKLPPDMGHML